MIGDRQGNEFLDLAIFGRRDFPIRCQPRKAVSMSSHSMEQLRRWIAFRLPIVAFVLTQCFAATVVAAEPKVTKVSHETVSKPAAAQNRTDEAADEDLSYSPQWPEPPNTGAMLLRLCLGTVVVLGLCVGTLWFGKPWLQRLKIAGAANSAFQVEGHVAVGNRAMLYLVRVGDTQLVAGTDATGLKSLIALPASFKDVLEEQLPGTEVPNPIVVAPFEVRPLNRVASKE